MSEDDSDDQKKKVVFQPMPEYKIRFTDMADHLVEKAIRSKFNKIKIDFIIFICYFL